MKNFLALDNLILETKDSINNIIQSSSEVSECSITNVLEENSTLIWISNEELPQEIILNLTQSFFKDFPKKITAIGIFCWHAYPTNPKLVEVLISKNNDNNFISFGNFDLCLKPGRQLLKLDENESNTNFLITENNNYTIKLIIKETYGDKRTYINNIYLYENIDFIISGIINVNTIDTIKEEEDSSSVFFLRESRERTLPRKKNNILSSNISINSRISNNNINNNNISNINISNANKLKNSNIVIKVNDELNNKDLTIDEFEIITKTKVKDNKINENNNKNHKNNLIINNTYDNDISNININNNIIATESQIIGNNSLFSSKNNIIKDVDLTNKNILLNQSNDKIDNIDEEINNINKNISKSIIEKENDNKKNDNNDYNNNDKHLDSLNVSLSSCELDSFGLLKGTKTHQKNFFNPSKISQLDEEFGNVEFQHSSSGYRFKTRNNIINKNLNENYLNIINSYSQKNSKKLKSNNDSQNINKNNNLNDSNKDSYKNDDNKNNNNNNSNEINQLKDEIKLLKEEFQNYKKEQEEINKQNQDKITNLESHIKKLQINSNKMNDVVKTLLEAQYIQNQTNNDYILNQMRKISSETFFNIFSNISHLANLMSYSSPTINSQNQNQNRENSIPYNENINNNMYIDINEERPKQQTYQTTRRKMYSIDKMNKQQNNYSLNYNINNNEIKPKMNNVYNKKFNDDLNIKANKLKKYNSGRNIILKKNYINIVKTNRSNNNNHTNYIKEKNYLNNDSIESTDNIQERQRNDNLFYQTGYPTEDNRNPFQRAKNINSNEILKINNNNFNSNIFNDKKEIHKRLLTNCYNRKTFSPNKRKQHSYVIYTDTDRLFSEKNVNVSNQNKNFNFNINNNENENENEIYEECSNEDAPLKVSQLKTEKRNNKIIKNKDNNDEEKENENKNIENNEEMNIFENFRNKLGETNEEIKQNSSNINQKYIKENINNNKVEKRNIGNVEKIINNRKKKITVKNDSLINLIHKYNKNNKDNDKDNKNNE